MRHEKKKVAVIFGGRSTEHDVSIITAHLPVMKSLESAGEFEVIPVYVAKDGSWYSDPAMKDLAYFQHNDFSANLPKKKLRFLFDDGLKLVFPGWREQIVKIDVAFPTMHGTYGEDGSLAGLLRMAGLPFVGCDIFASTVAMDKVLTKQVLEAERIPIVPYVWFTQSEWQGKKQAFLDKIRKLRMPLFVKPVHLGSSIAITKVNDQSQLENAVEVALHYDDKVLVEESIENLIEITLPMLGNESIRLASLERPFNKKEFFDFETKYIGGGKKTGGVNSQYSEIPANVDAKVAEEIRLWGEKTYHALGCSGMARVDFLIEGNTKKVFVNEVNPLPGSLYAHNWRKSGMSDVELVTKLIELAEERFQKSRNVRYTFDSQILKVVRGQKISR